MTANMDRSGLEGAERGKNPLEFLPASELPELIKDLRAGLDDAEGSGDLTLFLNELRAWQATGEVHADPALLARLTSMVGTADDAAAESGIDELVEVPRPQ